MRERAVICDFQQCDILTSVDSDEPVQPPFKLRHFKWCSVSSLISILPKNHADGDKWLVTEINNFTSINQTCWKTFTKQSISFFWQWLPWKPEMKISWRLAESCPRKNVKLALFGLTFVIRVLFRLHSLRALFRGQHYLNTKFKWKMKQAICIMFPSNKRITMETNFQNTKNWPLVIHISV